MNRDPSRISSQKVERMLEGRGIMKSSITPTRPRISHRSNRPTPSKRAFFEIRRANHLMRFESETDSRFLAVSCAVALMLLLFHLDRKSVALGKSVSVRVDLGARIIIKKKIKYHRNQINTHKT